MTNKDTVQNAHDEVSEEQKILQEKTAAVNDLLQQDPAAGLVGFLRFSEHGIVPDIKMVLIKTEDNDEDKRVEDTDTGSSEDSKGDALQGSDEPGTDEPSESQDSTG